jgi:hypothetical protein
LTIAVEYERPNEPRRATEVAHDLEVFRDLAFLA